MNGLYRPLKRLRRRRLRNVSVIATTLLLVAIAGCTGSSGKNGGSNEVASDKPPSSPSGSLAVSIYAGLTTMDPFQAPGSARTPNEQLMRETYEGLFALDNHLQVIPMLAKSYKASSDGKTYTIDLRSGVKFHNSDKTMDADDVIYSLKYFKEKGSQGYTWPAFVSVTAVNPTTVSLVLAQPSGGFIEQLASPDIAPIVPANSADNNGLADVDHGTGPYVITNFVARTSATLKPYADYSSLTTSASGFGGAKKALISTLTFRVIANQATAVAAFRTGEVGAIIRPAQQDVKALSSQSGLKVYNLPGSLIVDIDINGSKPPTDNTTLRQAIAYAMDRNAIFQAAGMGFGEVRDSFSPAQEGAAWFGDAKAPKWPYPYNPSKAKELVSESGYTGAPIEIIIGPTTYMPPVATILQQQLKAVGINATLTKPEETTWLSRGSSGDYGINVEGQSLFIPPDSFYAQYACGPDGQAQKHNSCDQSYDDLYTQAVASTDAKTRASLFLQMTKRLREMAVVVPIYAQSVLVGVNNKVHGFNANAYEWDNFYNVWVTS